MVAIMASEAETRINLTALQRQDPYISNILDSATQVAVYTFNHGSGEWVCCLYQFTYFNTYFELRTLILL